MKLSQRMQRIKPSATMAVTEKAAALRAKGIELIDFGAGEPDFDTPAHIKEAAVRALAAGQTKYTPVGGTAALKQAIIAKLKRENGLSYEPAEVMASCGGKHALYVAFQVLFGPGDEVIVPAPYWVSYPDMLALAGAKARIVSTREERGFKLRPEEIEEAISPATRAIILNSPSNPAGVAYDEAGDARPDRGHPPAQPLRHQRRRLRDDGVRRVSLRARAAGAAGPARAHAGGELGVEDLRHDRLARGLHRRPARGDQGHVDAAGADDVEPDVDRPGGGGRGPRRRRRTRCRR